MAAAAWALAQAPEPAPADAGGPPSVNHAPTLALHPAGEVQVRAGERAALAVGALDPDVLADGGLEPVWLSAAPAPGSLAPGWLPGTGWSAGPSARPRLEIALQPPPDALPQRFRIEAGATDARGLTTLAAVEVAVLAPLCAAPDFNDGGACRECPAHQVPDGSGRGCAPCGAGTARPLGQPTCAACPEGLSSGAGEACGCGPIGVLDAGRCVECPPHTQGAADGNWCAACPPGTERPAGALDCAAAPAAISGKSAPADPVAVVASLVGGGTALAEDAGEVKVRLALRPRPAAGNYSGCRLRLSAGGTADASDVTFSGRRKLTPANGWSGQAGLMAITDDALDEGDETLVVEGHCASSANGADPTHAALVSRPLALTIRDNDAALSLAVVPAFIGESLGRQAVEVAAVLGRPAANPVEVGLTLGTGAYSVAGTRRIAIAAGSTRGTTALAFTPTDDSNATDDAVAVDGTAAGHRAAAATLTILEPVIADGTDISGLGVALSVSPTALREGMRGPHRVTATLTGVPVPKADVAMVLAVGGTATEGASHDYTLKGGRDWRKLTVAAHDPHLTDGARVTVSARADGAEEGDETVTFTVAQAAWGTTVVPLRPPATAALTITEAWEAPPAPSGLTAAPSPGDERHGLDVAWEAVAANPPVDGYVVRHRRVSDPPAPWTASKPQPGLRAALAGLAAGTRHEVRVRADNAAGRGAESGSVFARTADGNCTVGAPQVAVPAGARSATELDVSWEAAACAPAASISNYAVRYRDDPEVEGVENAWLRETANGLTATLAGLAPDTAHVVAVRAVATGGDNGPWSPVGRGRTGLDARLPPRVAAPDVGPSADRGDARLDATWRRVSWTDSQGTVRPISEYQHRHRPDGGDWTAPTDARASGAEAASVTRTLAGLPSGTWHEVQVRGVNRIAGAAHAGKWSEPGRGRTWGAPDRVKEPAAYGSGGTVAVVWEAPDDGGSPINDYDVHFRAEGAQGWTAHPYAGCAPQGCETGTTIAAAATKVRVRAGNAVGAGAWSPTARAQALKLLRAAFGASSAGVAEGGSLEVAVRLDGAADRAVTVPLTASGDSDAFRLDGAPGGRVSFGAGESVRTFELAALQDGDRDGEAVTLGFGPLPAGVLAGSPAILAVAIQDDDAGNRKPTFPSAGATRSVAENSAAGAAVGAPVAAADGDGDPLTYSLSGTDAAAFAIDAGTGQVRVGPGTALDFEGGPASYALRVDVSDGRDEAGAADPSADASAALAVEVSDVAEPPPAPDAPILEPGVRSMSVGWSVPEHAGPPVTGHVLAHRASGAAKWTEAALDGTAAQAEVGPLSPGAAYEVRVRAVNDEGTGPWSAAAAANTLPAMTVEADRAKPEIGADGAPAPVTLTGRAEVAAGKLEGRWRRSDREGATEYLSQAAALVSGRAETLSASSPSPGWWLYALEATHELDGRESVTAHGAEVEWLPTVSLSADPAAVPEGGARTVTVTAALSGDRVTDAAKAVSVSVSGGTATAGEDFKAVEGFELRIAGGARSAEGTFELSALADSADEGAETVVVSGSAEQAGTALPVAAATVLIEEADPTLTVAKATHGFVTGTAGAATVIDCGSGGRSDCSETVARGASVALTATADAGRGFSGWTGDCPGREPCTVVVDADRSVGARFPALPGRPGAPALSPAGHDGLAASWEAPRGRGTGVTAYELRYRQAGAADWAWGAVVGGRTKVAIRDLAAGASHEVQVRAAAREGRGPWSALGGAATLPSVSLRADSGTPAIGTGGQAAPATLTASATAADGSLTGRWVRRTADGPATVNGQPFAMQGGREYQSTFSHDAPGLRAYGLMVTHGLNRGAGEVGGVVEIRWLPTVALSAAPSAVAEGGGARRVSVTARLTGSAVEDVAKSVAVRVGSGTATSGTDFKAVDGFTIPLPAGAREAVGAFELAPVADAEREGAETVAVTGSATQGGAALPVAAATVAIDDAVRRALTVAKPANGRITGPGIDCGGQGTDCAGTHLDGATVTLRAKADPGRLLLRWTGHCAGTGDCALLMDGDKSVGASFAAARTLTVAKPANGRITGPGIDCGGPGTDCAGTHPHGASVTLRAAPDSGHLLRGWVGDCSGTGGCVLAMDGDKSVGASFAAARTLTVAKPANGRITGPGIDCGGPGTDCAETHLDGASVTLKAAPVAGHLLRGWTGDCSGTGGCALAMGADRAVGASFAAARTLTVARPADGRVAGTANGAAVIDCGTDCTETLVDGTVVALSAVAADGHRFDAWGGACSAQAAAACSVTLDADRSVSASFALGATAGRCDGSRVDGCAAGRLNRTAFGDSPTHHRWRCDGTNGGANSPRCSKAKEDCSEGGRGWTAGGLNCFGTVGAAASGAVRPAEDEGDPTRGSASFLCDDGAWLDQPGASCTVDLGCGGSRNTCLTDGVRTEGVFETSKEDGACAATQAEGCTGGRPDRNSPADVALENGACGTGQRQCAGGTRRDLTPTEAAVRWRCLGTDAENRWSCLGTDGTGGWRCAYGGRSKSCSQPIHAVSDFGCDEVTREASDSPVCLWCRDGYHKDDNGVCVRSPVCASTEANCTVGTSAQAADTLVPPVNKWTCSSGGVTKQCVDPAPPPTCKANEGLALVNGELTCVCGADHHEDNGVCVRSPDCASTEANCTVGRSAQAADTLVPPVNKWTCSSGGVTKQCKDPAPPPTCRANEKLALVEGELTCVCEVGHHRYNSVCEPSSVCGSTEANCTVGRSAQAADTLVPPVNKWTCSSGGVTKQCVDPAPPPTCKANEGLALVNGELTCVCGAGYVRDDKDICVKQHKLTVTVLPKGKGEVKGFGKEVCTDSCTYDVNENTALTLTVTPLTGYDCIPTEFSITVTSDMSVTTRCTKRPPALTADAGGGEGNRYSVRLIGGTLPFGGSVGWYTATVSASATGGTPPYEFQWSQHGLSGARVGYIFALSQVFPVSRTVTVEDDADPAITAKATATIGLPGSSAAAAGSDGDFAFEVPLGGELLFAWGGGGAVTAQSEDAGVVQVAVSSPSFRVAGVGLGRTHVVFKAGGETMALPVVVR